MSDKVSHLLGFTFWCGEMLKNERESQMVVCAPEEMKQERTPKMR